MRGAVVLPNKTLKPFDSIHLNYKYSITHFDFFSPCRIASVFSESACALIRMTTIRREVKPHAPMTFKDFDELEIGDALFASM
jgi:hypothetical protein